MIGQAITPGEMLRADLMYQKELGQAPSPGELFRAAKIAEIRGAGMGVVGVIASAGLKAATPSIQKSLKGMLTGGQAKAARSDRTAAQDILVGLRKVAEALIDGTGELLAILSQGQRIDPFQLQEVDIAMQQTMQAWSSAAANYAQLVGFHTSLGHLGQVMGQAQATEVVRRLFLEGARLVEERMPQRGYFLRRIAEKVMSGQVPTTEQAERMFLMGSAGIALGRSASQKRADRLAWLKAYQQEFMGIMKALNDDLNKLAAAVGMTRATPGEATAAIDSPPTRPPEAPAAAPVVVYSPPPGAAVAPPPVPAITPAAPPGAPAGWFPPPAPKIPMWVWPAAGGALILILGAGFVMMKKPA